MTAASPFTYAIIGTEILSVLVCAVLMLGTKLKKKGNTRRDRLFIALTAVCMAGNLADMLSWVFDGRAELNTLLFILTSISTLLTLILTGIFIAYLTEYINEKKPISRIPVLVNWAYVGVASTLTVITSFTGDLFYFENGVYNAGHLYSAYIGANVLGIVIGFVIIVVYRKSLDLIDRIITWLYMLIPMAVAAVNVFIEDWSFAYCGTTISLLLVYVMLQSDHMESLQTEGEIESFNAGHDDLTGLNNRRSYWKDINILKDKGVNVGAVFSDVNGLKYTNDNFGHEAGDKMLIDYAEMLVNIFGKDGVYRISGDEFVCLVCDVPEETFSNLVNELKTVVKKAEPPIACLGAEFGSGSDVEDLIKKAEAVMYEEKRIVHECYTNITR